MVGAFPGSGHQLPQEEEIRRLQRENELLRQERDILKKALGTFSRSPRLPLSVHCKALPALPDHGALPDTQGSRVAIMRGSAENRASIAEKMPV